MDTDYTLELIGIFAYLLILIVIGIVAVALLGISIKQDYWQGLKFNPPWLTDGGDHLGLCIALGVVVFVLVYLHFLFRNMAAKSVIADLKKTVEDEVRRNALVNALHKNTRFFRSFVCTKPSGWGSALREKLGQVVLDADNHVQRLNDQFTDPSGAEKDPKQTGEKRG